jgi:prepilin-type N-terminal cleavage/methylation domain-containing protein
MKQARNPQDLFFGRTDAGLTLIEVIFAIAVSAVAVVVLYTSFILAEAKILANQQKLEAEALAMDKTLEIFNTYNFTGAVLSVSLPPQPVPTASLLPSNSEIRAMITPNIGSVTPYKWDVEALVKRDRFWVGGKTVTLTDDTVYRVTRYNIGRN